MPSLIADDLPARRCRGRGRARDHVDALVAQPLPRPRRRSSPPGSCRCRTGSTPDDVLLVVEAERVADGDARLLHRGARERGEADRRRPPRRRSATAVRNASSTTTYRDGSPRRRRSSSPRPAVLPDRPDATRTVSAIERPRRRSASRTRSRARTRHPLDPFARDGGGCRALRIAVASRSPISRSRKGRRLGARIEQVHLDAERREHAGVLAADHAAADHGERRRAGGRSRGSRRRRRRGRRRTGSRSGRCGVEPVATRIALGGERRGPSCAAPRPCAGRRSAPRPCTQVDPVAREVAVDRAPSRDRRPRPCGRAVARTVTLGSTATVTP